MNALLGAANVCIIAAILTALGLALYKGRDTLDSSRWLNLGHRWGNAIYMVATAWSVFITVVLCFPLYLPITLETMNWTCVVSGGVVVIAALYWLIVFRGKPPVLLPEEAAAQEVHDKD